MTTQSTDKILKLVLGSEIRRANLGAAPTFERLKEIIADLFQIPDPVLQYVDNEGESVTLGSALELEELFRFSPTSAPKVVVKGSPKPPPPPSSSLCKMKASVGEVATSSVPAVSRVDVKSDSKAKADVKDGSKEPTLSCEVVRELLTKLFSSLEVVTALPYALYAALNSLKANQSVEEALKAALLAAPVLASHESFQTLLPGLQRHFTALDGFRRQYLTSELLDQVKSALPRVLPMLMGFLKHMGKSPFPCGMGMGGMGMWGMGFPSSSPLPPWCVGRPRFGCFLRRLLPAPLWELIKPMWRDLFGHRHHRCHRDQSSSSETATTTSVSSSSSSSSGSSSVATSSASASTVTVHDHIKCDGCGQSPIRGVRYKCTVCHNFDLCETCEAKADGHPRHHPLIKMKEQSRRGMGMGMGRGCFGPRAFAFAAAPRARVSPFSPCPPPPCSSFAFPHGFPPCGPMRPSMMSGSCGAFSPSRHHLHGHSHGPCSGRPSFGFGRPRHFPRGPTTDSDHGFFPLMSAFPFSPSCRTAPNKTTASSPSVVSSSSTSSSSSTTVTSSSSTSSPLSTPPALTGPYASELERLREMGFTNDGYNLGLLTQHRGRMDRVIRHLLSQ